MQKPFGALCIAFAMLSIEAAAEFFVVPVGPNVGTKIDSLPYTITKPGFYYLAKDLNCTTTAADCLSVESSDVTVDLLGHAIYGPGQNASGFTGINLNSYDNIEIRNGTLNGAGYTGIVSNIGGGSGHRIYNMRVLNSGASGIFIGGYPSIVKNCTSINNDTHGIYIRSGSTAIGNTVSKNGSNGIYSLGSGASVIENTAHYNGGHGIQAASGNVIKGNAVYLNGGDGINAAYGNTVVNNAAYDNVGDGIDVSGNSLIRSNTAYSNDSGTDIDACGTCNFVDNLPNITNL